jgi:site-specific recombinase XerD
VPLHTNCAQAIGDGPCATLLLNARASVLTVQALLGHKHVDTTLRYARLYDSTVATDYERAMSRIEGGDT